MCTVWTSSGPADPSWISYPSAESRSSVVAGKTGPPGIVALCDTVRGKSRAGLSAPGPASSSSSVVFFPEESTASTPPDSKLLCTIPICTSKFPYQTIESLS